MPIAKDQQLLYEIVENMATMVRIMDEEGTVVYMNKSMKKEFGGEEGKKCYEIFGRTSFCEECVNRKAKETGEQCIKISELGSKFYRFMASPVPLIKTSDAVIEVIEDITEQKLLEKKFFSHYQKLKDDVDFAKHIQSMALPSDREYWQSLKVESSFLPSEDLGGDLYDIFRVDEDRCLFYIADVSGHGVRSAMMTMFVRQVIRGMKAGAADLYAVLDELVTSYHQLNINKEQYMSVLIGLYNMKTKGLSIINAGHNCPMLVVEQKEGKLKVSEQKVKGMPICSLLTRANHEMKILQMEKGDRILLYTDGISESYDEETKEAFGVDNIIKILLQTDKNGWEGVSSEILEAAKDFANPKPTDDMAVLAIEIL